MLMGAQSSSTRRDDVHANAMMSMEQQQQQMQMWFAEEGDAGAGGASGGVEGGGILRGLHYGDDHDHALDGDIHQIHGDNDDDDDAFYGGGGGDDDGYYAAGDAAVAGAASSSLDGVGTVVNQMMMMSDSHDDAHVFGGTRAGLDDEEDLAERVQRALSDSLLAYEGQKTYESICRAHIQKFLRGAEEFTRETQLSQRIAQWTARLEPLLDKEERAPPFDIVQYLSSIQTCLKSKQLMMGSKQMDFDFTTVLRSANHEIATANAAKENIGDEVSERDPSRSEVGRIFLACLQLANMGKVHITLHRADAAGGGGGGANTAPGEDSVNNFTISYCG